MKEIVLITLTVWATISLAASCKYNSYTRGTLIFTGDETCKVVGASCIIEALTCKIIQNVSLPNGSFVPPNFYKHNDDITTLNLPDFDAMGNLSTSNVQIPNLWVANMKSFETKDMILPLSVTSMTFENITSLNINEFPKQTSTNLLEFTINNCSLRSISGGFMWPNVTNITLESNALENFPKKLPQGLQNLDIRNNKIDDLNYLPENLTSLYLRNNSIKSIENINMRTIRTLGLSLNPLKVIYKLYLSKQLQVFACLSCNITNFTMNQETYEALNVLNALNESDVNSTGFLMNTSITVNEKKCSAISGEVKPLWVNKSSLTFKVCVIPDSLTTSDDNTVVIVGSVLGAVIVILIIVFIIERRRRKKDNSNSSGIENMTQRSSDNRSDAGLNIECLRIYRLDAVDIKVISKKPLASGAFGEVRLGKYFGEKVAIKSIKDRHVESIKKFIEEIMLMAKLDSAFIVRFIGVSWRRPIDLEVIVEYMNLGDLCNYLRNRKPSQFEWSEKFQCIRDIAHGLVYLHTLDPPIIHRDLKSRNVLLDSKKETKLSDFGISRHHEVDTDMTNNIGTFQWMAPEVMTDTKYTIAADIYSFGVMLSEFSTHAVPYSNIKNLSTGKPYGQQAIMAMVTKGKIRPTISHKDTPGWVHDLASQCMAQDPNDRPTSLKVANILQQVKRQFYHQPGDSNNSR